MGKRQHQKDKMYLTYTEWSTLYGGKRSGGNNGEDEDTSFRRLPFDHCCLSLQPFDNPYCDQAGNVFELEPLLIYLKHFKHNPVTGKPLDSNSLVKLNFYKNNSQLSYHCPVLFKPFTKHSHIVAVKTTGNVYSWEAVQQLNIKTRNWKDLINDEPFLRNDLIVIQDPNDPTKFNLSTFHHIKYNLRVEDQEIRRERNNPNAKLKTVSSETKEILAELQRDYKPAEILQETASGQKADKFNAAHYSTGAVAAGFTSTVMPRETVHEAAVVDEDSVRYERVKKKGYVRFLTNFGALNLELHCDIVPKTCENFLKHCQAGYYDGTKFHRSIRNFMIQGGDPSNTGNGGQSIWKTNFEDEFRPNLIHQGRGILSMANSGPNTNGSQFFITFRSCRNLDRKHSVFGKVVGGFETLNAIEKVEVDNKDRPIEDIILERAQVFVDPYQEADDQLAAERAADEAQQQQALINNRPVNHRRVVAGTETSSATRKIFRTGAGKYIEGPRTSGGTAGLNYKSIESGQSVIRSDTQLSSIKKKMKKRPQSSYALDNFSAW